jgi:hypothetical protein
MGKSSGPRGGRASLDVLAAVELADGSVWFAGCFAEHPPTSTVSMARQAARRVHRRRVTRSPP